ncbi:MAG: endonuclease III domain-containing protein [Candidatus Hydrothermarchaeaceae archaeon]
MPAEKRYKNNADIVSKVHTIVLGLSGITALENYYDDPFVVLISTILSQRTRDENTARATERLFSRYDTISKMADAPLGEIMELIYPVSFYRTKARRIREVSRIISSRYGGMVPDGLEELLSLPGVGRKTANCVLVYGFRKPAIPVDTHVHRVSNRLGLVETDTPEDTEGELREKIPMELWGDVNTLFVKFGQEICRPVNPNCDVCPIGMECTFRGRRRPPWKASL